MPDWLVVSIVVSAVLTVVANVVVRIVPRRSMPLEERLLRGDGEKPGHGGRRVQVYFPWKWMIALSVLGTIVLNLLA